MPSYSIVAMMRWGAFQFDGAVTPAAYIRQALIQGPALVHKKHLETLYTTNAYTRLALYYQDQVYLFIFNEGLAEVFANGILPGFFKMAFFIFSFRFLPCISAKMQGIH